MKRMIVFLLLFCFGLSSYSEVFYEENTGDGVDLYILDKPYQIGDETYYFFRESDDDEYYYQFFHGHIPYKVNAIFKDNKLVRSAVGGGLSVDGLSVLAPLKSVSVKAVNTGFGLFLIVLSSVIIIGVFTRFVRGGRKRKRVESDYDASKGDGRSLEQIKADIRSGE